MKDLDVLGEYMKEIGKVPLLSAEEEIELAKKAQSGDKAARDKLVKSNLRFVITIARKYQKKGLELSDLINEGNIGLLNAVDRFDVTKGFRFISYAVWWIRQAILRAISDKSRTIRIPANKVAEISLIQKAQKFISKNYSDKDEYIEIGKMLNLKPVHVQEMMALSREMVSLDKEVIGKDSIDSTLGDFIEDNINLKPDEKVLNESMKEEIHSVMSTLKPAEREVLSMRYGLNGEKPKSLQEIGDIFNLTKERIRQIEKNAMTRMMHPVRKSRLEVFVA